MHIAVVGCGHGEIDKIYEVIENIENTRGIRISLLLCCGDFQSVRNMTDLRCMACPIKYQQMHDFHRYYSGEKKAPVLTLFIGGNHEASNFLQELPYGGWVAPNIFYMGYVGVFKFGQIRIAGLSGIYKGQDYLKGRYEAAPYDQGTMRSVYHYRNLDIFRLKQLKQPVDIVLSHDWPKGIHQFGNTYQLLRKKPFFRDEIERNELGSRPLFEVLEKIQPKFWFSAHMHVKFAAYVEHPPKSDQEIQTTQSEDEKTSVDADSTSANKPKNRTTTKFLALDKVLPRRQFLQIIEIPEPNSTEAPSTTPKLEYDAEWLAVLKSTNHLISLSHKNSFMPGPGGNTRFDFTPTEEELAEISGIFEHRPNFLVPDNFSATSSIYSPGDTPKTAFPIMNPQTREFCEKLQVTDPLEDVLNTTAATPVLGASDERSGRFSNYSSLVPSQLDITMNQTSQFEDSLTNPNPDEISLDLDDDNEADKDKAESNTKAEEPVCRSKLVLPPPKTSTEKEKLGNDGDEETGGTVGASAAELELLRSVMGATEEPESGTSSLFFIDTAGDDEQPHIKRRKDLGSFKY